MTTTNQQPISFYQMLRSTITSTPITLVAGPTGCSKTATLCHIDRLLRDHKDTQVQQQATSTTTSTTTQQAPAPPIPVSGGAKVVDTILHLAGTTLDSSQPHKIVRRLIIEISRLLREPAQRVMGDINGKIKSHDEAVAAASAVAAAAASAANKSKTSSSSSFLSSMASNSATAGGPSQQQQQQLDALQEKLNTIALHESAASAAPDEMLGTALLEALELYMRSRGDDASLIVLLDGAESMFNTSGSIMDDIEEHANKRQQERQNNNNNNNNSATSTSTSTRSSEDNLAKQVASSPLLKLVALLPLQTASFFPRIRFVISFRCPHPQQDRDFPKRKAVLSAFLERVTGGHECVDYAAAQKQLEQQQQLAGGKNRSSSRHQKQASASFAAAALSSSSSSTGDSSSRVALVAHPQSLSVVAAEKVLKSHLSFHGKTWSSDLIATAIATAANTNTVPEKINLPPRSPEKFADVARIITLSEPRRLSSPFYTRLLINELVATATFETLSESLNTILKSCETTQSLLVFIARRIQRQLAGEQQATTVGDIAAILLALTVPKIGIKPEELATVCAVPLHTVLIVVAAFKDCVDDRAGMLRGGHRLRKVVADLVPDERERSNLNDRLRAMFVAVLTPLMEAEPELVGRCCREVPGQLLKLNRLTQLASFLSIPAVMLEMFVASKKLEYLALWRAVMKHVRDFNIESLFPIHNVSSPWSIDGIELPRDNKRVEQLLLLSRLFGAFGKTGAAMTMLTKVVHDVCGGARDEDATVVAAVADKPSFDDDEKRDGDDDDDHHQEDDDEQEHRHDESAESSSSSSPVKFSLGAPLKHKTTEEAAVASTKAQLLQRLAQAEASEHCFNASVATARRALRYAAPEQRSGQLKVLARCLRDAGQYAEALSCFEYALELIEHSSSNNNRNTKSNMFKSSTSPSRNSNTNLLQSRLALKTESTSIFFQAQDHDVSSLLAEMGDSCRKAEQLQRAQELLKRALQMKQKVLPPTHPSLALVMYSVAATEFERGDVLTAAKTAAQAISIFSGFYGSENPKLSNLKLLFAKCCDALCDFATTRNIVGLLYAWTKQVLGPDSIEAAEALQLVGKSLMAQNAYSRALEILTQSHAILTRKLLDSAAIDGAQQHPKLAKSLLLLTALSRKIGKHRDAAKHAEEALAVVRSSLGEDNMLFAECSRELGWCLLKLASNDDHAEAQHIVDLLQHATRIAQRKVGDNPRTASILVALGDALRKQSKLIGAIESYEKAQQIYEEAFHQSNSGEVIETAYKVGRCRKKLHQYNKAKAALSDVMKRILDVQEASSQKDQQADDTPAVAAASSSSPRLIAAKAIFTAYLHNEMAHMHILSNNNSEGGDGFLAIFGSSPTTTSSSSSTNKTNNNNNNNKTDDGTAALPMQLLYNAAIQNVGDCHRKLFELDMARACYNEALASNYKLFGQGASHEEIAEDLNGLAQVRFLEGANPEAKTPEEQIEILTDALQQQDVALKMTIELLGPTHRHTANRTKNRREIFDKIRELTGADDDTDDSNDDNFVGMESVD